MEILVKYLETRDWKTAFFQVIPQRKRCEIETEVEDHPNNNNNNREDEDGNGKSDDQEDNNNKRYCAQSLEAS